MARCLRIAYPGAFYHVTCRGNARQDIFTGDRDRRQFEELLATALKTYGVVLHAYIQMTNHFHLVVETPRANLSEFMRYLDICYTGWFNHRHRRCGHLLQGRFKAFLIQADAYLLAASRYVHLNRIRAARKARIAVNESWLHLPWSSLPGYLDERHAQPFINYDLTLSLAGGRRDYRELVREGLKQSLRSPFEDLRAGAILGTEEFINQVKRDYLGAGSSREQPSYRELAARVLEPRAVLACVAGVAGIPVSHVTARQGNSAVRGIAAELLYRYCGLKLKEIGQLLGNVDYTTVSQLRRRLSIRMRAGGALSRQYGEAENQVRALQSSARE